MRSATSALPAAPSRLPVARGAGQTHVGRVRDRNEDAILTDPSGRLWAVADGMGGLGHGDIAADIVIDSLETIDVDDAPMQALDARLADANAIIRARAEQPGMGPMGATVVAAIIDRGCAQIAWAGDSRAYLMRDGKLTLVTRDHTLVQALVERGELSDEAALHHPESHIVTRAVGGDDVLEVEQRTLPLVQGDRILLCSDGLQCCVIRPAIAGILSAAAAPQEACRDLIRAALEAGAPDNISVIVIDVREI